VVGLLLKKIEWLSIEILFNNLHFEITVGTFDEFKQCPFITFGG